MALSDTAARAMVIAMGNDPVGNEVVAQLNTPTQATATITTLTSTTGTVTTLTSTTGTVTTLTSTTATLTTATITTLNTDQITMSAAAGTMTLKANLAAALTVSDGTTGLYIQDTRNTVTVQNHVFDSPASQTLPNGATSRWRNVSIAAHTVTLAGTTQVTTANDGVMLWIGAPTVNQSGGAVTVDAVSSVFIGTPVAGTSVTITKNSFVQTGVSGCFCSAAGTWTDSSSKLGKVNIRPVDMGDVAACLEQVDVVKFKKKATDDGDYERFGVIAEDVPDFLACHSRTGVAAIHLAGFAMAAVKYLKAENDALKARLDKLEAA